MRERAEILADVRFYFNASPEQVATVAAECESEPVDYLENAVENIVAEAIEAGLIVEDLENNGWHEGYRRMTAALLELAEAR